MYLDYYGFHTKPFSLLPDAAALYPSKRHTMAMATLEYGLLNLAGFTLLTGEIGSGKTTLIRNLLNLLEDDVTVGVVANTHRSFGGLLQWIVSAFGIQVDSRDNVVLYNAFVDFAIAEYGNNRRVVLVVDEAQNLGAELLEELRVLSNLNTDIDQILQVILVGQPELRDIIKQPGLEQFAQRILVDYHLEALAEWEIEEYIQHRLLYAGGDPKQFDASARRLVAVFSAGIPRVANILCDTALVYGYAGQMRTIGASVMREVIRDKSSSGILPLKKTTGLGSELTIASNNTEEVECKP